MKTIVLYLAGVWLACAQIGTPGGGYPTGTPGGYPYPGRGNPIPGVGLPGRTRKSQPGSTAGQPLPNFRGKLKNLDTKTLTLELDDNRVLEFTVNGKTKFFKSGDEVKSPKFNPGDQLSVEGPQDPQGFLTAVNVYWEKAAAAGGQTTKDGAVDTWKDAKDAPKEGAKSDGAKETPKGAAPPKEAANDAVEDVTLPPPPPDPNRPVLKRGKPPARASEPVTETNPPAGTPLPAQAPQATREVATNLPPSTVALPGRPDALPPEDQTPLGSHQEDPLIAKAIDAALEFTETLPSYVVQEMISRYQSERKPADWSPIDVVSMDLVYENHKEDYRNLKVNGKPVNKKLDEIGGAWSSGEFGTILINLFSPATQAEFHARRDGRIAGVNARIYDYEVKRENSNWTVKMASQTFVPGYRGSVWLDPKNGRVLRIEMQARGLPSEFPADSVETALDYEYVRLGGTEQFLLPTHSENLTCQRGTSICSKNTIDFRNYHKYAGESTIEFHDVK